MKTLLVTLNGNSLDKRHVICRSHETSTPEKILNSLEDKLKQNGRSQNEIHDYEIISGKRAEEAQRNYLTYYLQSESEEPYANYYGAKWNSSNPVANGPVGYSEK